MITVMHFFMQWFENNPRYKSKDEHLRHMHVGRHRTPREKSPPGIWDISFPDTESD